MKADDKSQAASKLTIQAAALVLALVHGGAWAWGSDGHQIVAHVAQQQLTPHARQEIQKLLDLEPGATLESISTWADDTKNKSTARWHYVNFPKGDCLYQAERDCPDGNCIVEAINRQVQALKTAPTAKQRLTALKYVVHLVADIHQPLHGGWGEDRGGNTYQLQAFKRGTNLHALWDSGLIRYYQEQDANWLQSVLQRTGPTADTAWRADKVAQESCELVRQGGFYPTRRTGAAYAETYKGILGNRLASAGNRLAQQLNAMWP